MRCSPHCASLPRLSKVRQGVGIRVLRGLRVIGPSAAEPRARLRATVVRVLSCFSSNSPGAREMLAWLDELERGDLPGSRVRQIAQALRGRAVELERQAWPPALAEAARELADAAWVVLARI